MNDKKYKIFPDYSDEQRAGLRKHLADGGIVPPVHKDQDGNTLDGFQREAAAGGKPLPTLVIDFATEEEKVAHILAQNVPLRQLTTKLKEEVIEKVLRLAPGLTPNYLAELLHVDHKTVARVREDLLRKGEIPECPLQAKDGRIFQPRRPRAVIATTAAEQTKAQAVITHLPEDAPTYLTVRAAKKRAGKARRSCDPPNVLWEHDDVKVSHADFRDWSDAPADGTVQLIVSDLPWGDEYHPLWADLGEFAAAKLADPGALVAWTGQCSFEHAFVTVRRYLKYHGKVIQVHDAMTPLHQQGMFSMYRDILIFCKGDWRPAEYLIDRLQGAKDKQWHPWGQPLEPVRELVRRLTRPGDLVCDPTCGGGTTAHACLLERRRCLTCDRDEECVRRARQRLSEAILDLSEGGRHS